MVAWRRATCLSTMQSRVSLLVLVTGGITEYSATDPGLSQYPPACGARNLRRL
jgi:hypothetical protein